MLPNAIICTLTAVPQEYGNIVVAAVDVCTGVVPGTEYSLDSAHELFLRIVREVLADLCLILSLELVGQLLQVVSGQLDVLRYALLLPSSRR